MTTVGDKVADTQISSKKRVSVGTGTPVVGYNGIKLPTKSGKNIFIPASPVAAGDIVYSYKISSGKRIALKTDSFPTGEFYIKQILYSEGIEPDPYITVLCDLGGGVLLAGAFAGYMVVTEYHIWRSIDYGATWIGVKVFVPPVGAYNTDCVSLYHVGGNVVIAGVISREMGTGSYYATQIWRSADAGLTWTCVQVFGDHPDHASTDNCSAVWSFCESSSGVLYTVMQHGSAAYYHIYFSIDGGISWTLVQKLWAGPGKQFISITSAGTMFLSQGEIVIMGDGSLVVCKGAMSSGGRVLRSTDGGMNFVEVLDKHDGIYRSTNDGITWNKVLNMSVSDYLMFMSKINGSTAIFYSSDGNCMYSSRDYGVIWTLTQTFTGPSYCTSNVVSPRAGLLVCGATYGVYQYIDWCGH